MAAGHVNVTPQIPAPVSCQSISLRVSAIISDIIAEIVETDAKPYIPKMCVIIIMTHIAVFCVGLSNYEKIIFIFEPFRLHFWVL